ncbi:hypothetical protein BH23CYA1_BH23CYA1_24330 [soil metagenome]
MRDIDPSWWIFALLSAFFAALTTVFAKVGVESVNSNLVTAIRMVVILAVAWEIVWAKGEWQGWADISHRSMLFLVLSGLATGLGCASKGKYMVVSFTERPDAIRIISARRMTREERKAYER